MSLQRTVFIFGALTLLGLGVLLLMGGASATCSASSLVYSSFRAADGDYDGYNDSVALQAEFGSPTGTVTVNGTIWDPSYTFVLSSDTDTVTHFLIPVSAFLFMPMPDGWDRGTFPAVWTVDEGAGPCDYYSGSFDLWPRGVYAPALNASVLLKDVPQGETSNLTFTVTNNGNLPDTIGLSSYCPIGWSALVMPSQVDLNVSESTLVQVFVNVPALESPGTECLTIVSASSLRNSTASTTLDLTFRVEPQIFTPIAFVVNETKAVVPGAMVTYDVVLENRGNNLDNLTLSTATPPTGWTASFNNISQEVAPGGRAYAIMTVGAPVSLTGALVWSFDMVGTSKDGITTSRTRVTATMVLPDLVIGAGDISLGVGSPTEGETVSVDVTVRNLGSGVSIDLIVRLSDGIANQSQTVSIGLTGTASASFSWVARPGTTQLVVTADAGLAIPESNEANNAATKAITVNLKPVAVASATAGARAGEAVTITATSSHDAEGAVSQYYYDFGDGQNSGWVANATITHTYLAAGSYQVHVRVRDSQNAESADTTQTVTVAAAVASAPSPTDSSMMLYLLLAVAAAGAVGALLFMRSRKPKAPVAAPPASPPESPKPPSGGGA